jgi:PAS domain S-box-containing protein
MQIFLNQWKMLFAFLAALTAVLGYELLQIRADTLAEQRGHLVNLTRISSEIIERQLLAADALLEACIRDFCPTPDRQKNLKGNPNHEFERMASIKLGTEILMYLTPDGVVRATNRSELLGQNFSGRHYFQAARNATGSAERILSPPFRSVLGNYTLTISRKLLDAEGHFNGVVMVTMDTPYISRLLGSTLYALDMWSALAHGDGTHILMIPENPGLAGTNIATPGSFFVSHLQSPFSETVHEGPVARSGEDSIVVIRTIQPSSLNIDQPLVLGIGRAKAALFAKWRQQLYFTIAMLIGIGSLSILAMWMYQKRMRTNWETIERQRALVATTTDGIHVLDMEGRLIDANPAFLKHLGIDESVIGKIFTSDFDTQLSMDATRQIIRRLRESGANELIETRHRHRDGHLIDVEISCRCFELNGDWLVFASARDISERKRAEDALRKLSMAVEQSPESVMITDISGAIEYVNQAFLLTSGYSWAELKGNNPRLLSSGQTPRSTYQAMWSALTLGQSWKGEFINQRKNGEIYIESEIISPIRQDDGQISHYLAIKQDITEQKQRDQELSDYRNHLEEKVDARTIELRRANEELIVARQAADAAARSKSAFLANMSHEIRTPMNGIIGMLHLLQRGEVTPVQGRNLAKMEHSANHLLNIINDILDLSKIDAGRLTLEKAPFTIRQIVDTVLALISDSAAQKGLVIEASLGELPPVLLGDETRLTQALLNYVSNAVKFTNHGQIRITIEHIETKNAEVLIKFAVEDTGPGIEAEAVQRLFSAFEQADNSITRRHGGTGLGLAITRRLAELMGGTVGVNSQPGCGSTFWFSARFEICHENAPGNPQAILPKAEALLRERHAGKLVLLVEDEPINQEISRTLLEEIGLVVEVAGNGIEALSLLEQNRYALVLMDMQMPELDGLETTRRLRRQPALRNLPVIAMTANAFVEDRQQCLAAGMNAFVAKPVKPEILFSTLLEWLDKTG